ncbi:MAG: ACP S-malonyltransferase [Eubacteriales bacterium]|nr:ACP S-malonyltransferase [Eubacteriales bacterium]MDD3199193.1 ACP S-malonyltransferase [Eubacteriales bacterium]MDD4121799.1 ACP S-malonyltransferase [Eubacteriales bacterium]MDD4629152.1 ACP S-malonyltransferase [Eubacteriales bacterium]
MKVGLLFAGQGAQYPGMGKSLYDNSKEAKKVFDLAGQDIQQWCFEGSKELLRQTNITQPCVYTVTMAAYEAFLKELSGLDEDILSRVEIKGMAGFSLGEYAALTAGGAIQSFETGLKIVRNRGVWMSDAGKNAQGENIGGMIAAFGERKVILECVEAAREDGILEGVNFNSPAQTVVAGDKDAQQRFLLKSKEVGGIKTVPLSVGTAFHSSMMKPAVPKLLKILLAADLKKPTVKTYSNVTGKDIMEGQIGEDNQWLAQVMAKQAERPVYWQETIENMNADGISIFIEFGPGKTLSGLARKINSELIVMNIEDNDTLMETMDTIKNLISEEETK